MAIDVRRKDGLYRIEQERRRQIFQEGWSSTHDDQHSEGQIASAACSYVGIASYQAAGFSKLGAENEALRHAGWPWDLKWLKVDEDPIRNLEKAGALIAAEIDRLLRLREKQK